MGVAIDMSARHAYLLEQLDDAITDLPMAERGVCLKRLADNAQHTHPGIQRGVGVLKHDLHIPAHPSQPPARQAEHVCSLEEYLPTCGLDKTQETTSNCGLSAAGLTHEAKGCPAPDVEGYAIHRPHDARVSSKKSSGLDEVLHQVADLYLHVSSLVDLLSLVHLSSDLSYRKQ